MNRDAELMDCERYDKIALNLLYGELDELTAAAAKRHLHHCTRCKGISSGMQATKELASVPLLDPPVGLHARILQAERLAHKELSLRERIGRTVSVLAGYAMRPQLAMAALLLLMVSTSLVFQQARPTEHDQVSVTERGVPGLEAEAMPRHSIVTEALPPEAPAQEERSIPRPAIPSAPARSESRALRAETSSPARTKRAAEPEAAAEGAAQDAPPPTFERALEAYHAGRYAEAERQFRRVAAAGGPQAPRAALHEAHAARNGSGCQQAADLYDTVAARYAGTPIADEASWHAASCYRAVGQQERAAAHYRRLASQPGYAERASQALAALEADAPSSADAIAARKESKPTKPGAATTGSVAGPAPAAAAPAAPRPQDTAKGADSAPPASND